MNNLFSAREILAESYRNRLESIRDDSGSTPWLTVAEFHIPINESIPDREERKRRCLAHASQMEQAT